MKDIFDIKVKTILVEKPGGSYGEQIVRRPVVRNELHETLILKEAHLRKLAYKNAVIETGESFFDDSDMRSNYYLTIIYHSGSGVPLLSSRYYFDRSVISKNLRGDENKEPELLNLEKFKESEVFLADRLSGNTSSSVYRRNRNFIFLLYYSELLKHNKGCKFIIMARKEASDKLLKKYLKLGFEIFGFTKHKGRDHWILLSDFKKSYAQLRSSVMLNVLLLSRGLFFR